MSNLVYHRQFLKHYRSRIKSNLKLRSKYDERLRLWLENKNNPVLKDHGLTGDKIGLRAFWITGDIRVTYKMYGDDIEFYDVGSHNQVYK